MNEFSRIAKFLHWSVAGLIVGQYVLAKLAENAKHNDEILQQLALLANHKSVGITILVLAIIRLIYRTRMPAPSLPLSMSAWQVNASKASHILLYGFLFALPISGWLMSSAKAYSVSWFNVLALPDFVAPNESLAEQLHAVHYYLAEALFVIALIHILAALKHHYVDKDSVLTRMASFGNWMLFGVTIVLVVGLFGRLFDTAPSRDSTEAVPAIVEKLPTSNTEFGLSDLPIWDIDYQQSYIKFVGDQAGAPFEGQWQRWSADIQFDNSQLDKARFKVTIDVASGFTNDQERDDTIRSSDFFDVSSFPEASYSASVFSQSNGAYESMGKLSMKAVTSDVVLSFDVSNDGGSHVLNGTASLDRFIWNIGSGDWADPTWVGQNVKVEVHVVTKP